MSTSTEDANWHRFLKTVLPKLKLPAGVLAFIAFPEQMKLLPLPVVVAISATLLLRLRPILADVVGRCLGRASLVCGVLGFVFFGPYGCTVVVAGPVLGLIGKYGLLVGKYRLLVQMKKWGHISEQEFKTFLGCLLVGLFKDDIALGHLDKVLPVPTQPPPLTLSQPQQAASPSLTDKIEQQPKDHASAVLPTAPIPAETRRKTDANAATGGDVN